jgi:protein-tyrosine phosphatase
MPTPTLNAELTQRGQKYVFILTGFEGSCSINYHPGPDYKDNISAAKTKAGLISVKAPINKRLLFTITDESQHTLHTATRLVKGTGIPNLRDLGGYTAADGRRVRWGILYRGPGLFDLNKAEKQYMQTLGLRTVFDLRSRIEVGDVSDWVPEKAEYFNFSGIPTMDEEEHGENLDMKSLVLQSMKDPNMLAYLRDYLPNAYRTMAQRTTAFSELFSILLQKPGQPILFHCSAGKDRTGVSAALILRALGVSQDVIMQDYLLSNTYRASVNRPLLFKLRLAARNKQVYEALKEGLLVSPELLQATFDTINESYGSFDAFLGKSLGLTSADVKALQDTYLE